MTKQKNILVVLVCIASFAAAYVGSYVVNSSQGGYWMTPERDGHDRYGGAIPATTAFLWQPARGYHTPWRASALGKLYSPLITLDRKFVHPTHYMTDDGWWEWTQKLSVSEMHPDFRKEALEVKQKEKTASMPLEHAL